MATVLVLVVDDDDVGEGVVAAANLTTGRNACFWKDWLIIAIIINLVLLVNQALRDYSEL